MKVLLYTAGDAASHKELGKQLQDLKPGTYVIEVKRNRPVRSLSANKYYHALLNIAAIETGITHNDLHEAMKYKFNSKVVFFPSGGSQCIGNSTSDLNSAEFAGFVNRVKQYFTDEVGLIIPEQKDIDYKTWIEIQNTFDENFNG